ncbi:MAG: glutamate--tRNA ligase [Woeseia sp.]|nr:glutamate--tRNA ligase [Woeseia sp.]|tara:strand:- start:85 stop:1536 length:1452 start_codon:yes stop_codon:yes gene_type:complete
MNVRTRFAPSPTGSLHLGSIRTALFNWLYARHHKGTFILRVEDTDRVRSTKENIEAIIEGMSWLDLEPDEGPIFQTDRYERYKEIIDVWLNQGKAYYCYCSKERLDKLRTSQMSEGIKPRYDRKCRDVNIVKKGVHPVVRFKNPLNGSVTIKDQVKGNVIFENSELDDLIIARSDGTPTYNFTVVVDDFDMRITHVIRGDDHLNNTPRQINMFSALGVEPPSYAHLPMILGPDGAKLSKRHGAEDIRNYREKGYLSEAILNYMVRLGWSFGDQEIFSIEDMIKNFNISNINQSASSFNPEKLLWINQQHIINSTSDKLGLSLVPFMKEAGINISNGPALSEVADGFKERAETLYQMAHDARYCFEDFNEIDPKAAKKNLRKVILEPLKAVRSALSGIRSWEKKVILEIIKEIAESFEINMGKLGQPIRVAVTGNSVSPPIDTVLMLIGKEKSIARLDFAIQFIETRSIQDVDSSQINSSKSTS